MIQKITITVATLFKRILTGPARRFPLSPSRIIVAQMGRLGDMVCTTPVFRALKGKYPKAKIIVVGMPGNSGILKDHPYVDEYYSYSGDTWKLARFLKKGRFDAAILCGPHGLVLSAMLFTSIPLVSVPKIIGGESPYETRIYRLLRNFALVKPHNMLKYAPREYLRLLEPLGIFTDDTQKTLSYSAEALKSVQLKASEAGIKFGAEVLIGITPTAGNKIKEWPAERFGRLAGMISKEYGYTIVVLGSPKDRERVKEMIDAVAPEVKIWNTCGELGLDELKALIAHLDCLIAVDTGPIYIAEAFGVATVDLVGPVDENVQPPKGERHIIVRTDVPGYPFLRIMNARIYDSAGARKSVLEITPEMIMEKSRELLTSLRK